MDVWVWLTVYLVGFVLFQLILYRYVRGGDSTHEGSGETAEAREPGYKRLERAATGGDPERNPQADVDDESEDDIDGVVCRHCGAVNESHETFSYCRECAGALR